MGDNTKKIIGYSILIAVFLLLWFVLVFVIWQESGDFYYAVMVVSAIFSISFVMTGLVALGFYLIR
jgi:hypothetical protein